MEYTVSYAVQAALERLLAMDEIADALNWIQNDQARCVSEQKRLTLVEAPSFHEQERAEVYAGMFQELGLSDVRIDQGGNVLGLRKGQGGGPRILVEAHMDTVFPLGSVKAVKEGDGFLFAPGISDDTRGLAIILSMIRALDACGIQTRGDLLFAGTTREEGMGGMEGVKFLLNDQQGKIDACVSIDSASMATIIYEATGLRTVEVTFHGIGGHAFGAFGQVANPLHAAARAVAKIADLQVPQTPKTTFCVSNFHAGNDAGVHAIPPSASIKINYRSNDAALLEALDQQIFQAIEEACAEETARWGKDAITWDSRTLCDIPAGSQSPHAPVVEGLYAVLKAMGLQPVFQRGGATNCSIAIAQNIPAVCIGTCYCPGGENINTLDHTLEERFPVAGAYKGVQAALLTALLCAGVGKEPTILRC